MNYKLLLLPLMVLLSACGGEETAAQSQQGTVGGYKVSFASASQRATSVDLKVGMVLNVQTDGSRAITMRYDDLLRAPVSAKKRRRPNTHHRRHDHHHQQRHV